MLKKIISMSLISAALLSTIPVSAAWKQNSDSSYMYVDENGQKTTGWKFIYSDWYYFDTSGVMRTGWITDNGSWYYLWSTGQMATNSWIMNDGKAYYVGSDGKVITDNVTVDFNKYNLKYPTTILSEGVSK